MAMDSLVPFLPVPQGRAGLGHVLTFLLHRIPFFYLAKLFLHGHGQLRNKRFINRSGRIPLGASATRQAGATDG